MSLVHTLYFAGYARPAVGAPDTGAEAEAHLGKYIPNICPFIPILVLH